MSSVFNQRALPISLIQCVQKHFTGSVTDHTRMVSQTVTPYKSPTEAHESAGVAVSVTQYVADLSR